MNAVFQAHETAAKKVNEKLAVLLQADAGEPTVKSSPEKSADGNRQGGMPA
jgi:hypothetical protein